MTGNFLSSELTNIPELVRTLLLTPFPVATSTTVEICSLGLAIDLR
jgi:hypothetical protein